MNPRTRAVVLCLAAVNACGGNKPAPTPAPEVAGTCFFLRYSDPAAGARAGLFPAWVRLLEGPERGAVESRPANTSSSGAWQKLSATARWTRSGAGFRIAATEGLSQVGIELRRDASGFVGTATYRTDEILPGPEPSMAVVAYRADCPG